MTLSMYPQTVHDYKISGILLSTHVNSFLPLKLILTSLYNLFNVHSKTGIQNDVISTVSMAYTLLG